MAIIKPTKPDSELPKTWGGTQYPYTEEQIAEGLPEAIPTIIDGGTLNYEKKGVFERMEYVTQVSDAVAGAPIKKTLITNANNQFDYAGIGVYSYSATQVYALDDFVITSTNEGTKIYKSLSNNNIGKELTNETYWEELSLGGGSGLEIGDIGIAPLGIDETQNKRRYLNGQVISQVQFVSFTNKIKEAVALYPNIATTEVNWQAEVTNSVLGQCGKFVIDDNAGTIRLPKVVNINGLQDLSLLGGIKAESLPNITGDLGSIWKDGGVTNGCFASTKDGNYRPGAGSNDGKYKIKIDASLSSSTYQDNAPVQQEAIQYPYFIQVATGVEESVDVTREIELNNPFSLLDYKWSEYEITNASWLLSNGAFHSGATYVAVYELLLKIKNGAVTKDGVSVKLHEQMMYAYYLAGSYSYWFTTEKVVVGQDVYGYEPFRVCGKVISVTDTNITIHDDIANSDRTLTRFVNGDSLRSIYTDTDFVINTEDTTFRLPIKVKLASGNAVGLKLYFYVGETIQDANVIAASQVLTTVADSVRKSSATDRETVVGWGMPDYSRGYTIPTTNDYTGTLSEDTQINITTRQDVFADISFIVLDDSGTEISRLTANSHKTGLYEAPCEVSSIANFSKNTKFRIRSVINSGDTSIPKILAFPLKGAN